MGSTVLSQIKEQTVGDPYLMVDDIKEGIARSLREK